MIRKFHMRRCNRVVTEDQQAAISPAAIGRSVPPPAHGMHFWPRASLQPDSFQC
jgi:hypothetical protein